MEWVAKQTGGNFELYSYQAAARSMEPSQARKAAVQPAPTREQRERDAGPPPRRDDVRFVPAVRTATRPFEQNAVDGSNCSPRCFGHACFTGAVLEGTLAQQNEQCDAIARRFRGYSDGRLTVWDRWA